MYLIENEDAEECMECGDTPDKICEECGCCRQCCDCENVYDCEEEENV